MAIELIKTTCPRDCYDGCGIVVERQDGAIRRVLGDKEHAVSRGSLCAKCAWARSHRIMGHTDHGDGEVRTAHTGSLHVEIRKQASNETKMF